MNILLINHYAGSPKYGMEYRPYYLAREWARLGHQVTIIASTQSHVRSHVPEIKNDFSHEMIDGIQYVWIATPSYKGNGVKRVINIFAFVLQLFRYSKRIIARIQPDVVIHSSTYPLDVYPARHVARRSKAKLIFEVHDLWPLSPIELGGMSPWHPFIQIMQRAENDACKSSDYVVSLLPYAKEHLQEHGMAPYKFSWIPNGINISEWESKSSTMSSEHSIIIEKLKEEKKFLIGYAGGHALSNALNTVIESADELRFNSNIAFVLVGEGVEKAQLQEEADRRGLSNLIFLSSVPKSAIPHLLSQMDTLYLGWRNHSIYRFGISPNKLMDYMMSGKPILHSISAGNDPIAESGCGLSVPAEDPQAIAQAAQKLAKMPSEELHIMGLRGRQYVLQHHDYAILAQKFLNCINDDSQPRSPGYSRSLQPTKTTP
jgi:glycosyltransferase involved in cell wall biosynthesis